MHGLECSVRSFVEISDYEDEIFGYTKESEGSGELCMVYMLKGMLE